MPWCIARLSGGGEGGKRREASLWCRTSRLPRGTQHAALLLSRDEAVSNYREGTGSRSLRRRPPPSASPPPPTTTTRAQRPSRVHGNKGKGRGRRRADTTRSPFWPRKDKAAGRRGRWPTCSFFRLSLMNRGTRIPSPPSFSLIVSSGGLDDRC